MASWGGRRECSAQRALLILGLLHLTVTGESQSAAATNRSSVAVLLRRDFRDWCKRDAEDATRKSYHTQFVEGVAGVLNVSTADVEVLQICTGDDSRCLVEEATCPPNARLDDGGTADTPDEEAGGSEEAGPEMASRMQVMFAVPPERVATLAAFMIASPRAVSRMEILLVDMPPANPAAAACGGAGGRHDDPWSRLASLLGDGDAVVRWMNHHLRRPPGPAGREGGVRELDKEHASLGDGVQVGGSSLPAAGCATAHSLGLASDAISVRRAVPDERTRLVSLHEGEVRAARDLVGDWASSSTC